VGTNRAGRWTLDTTRTERTDFVRRNWRVLAVASLPYLLAASVAILVSTLSPFDWFLPFTAGVLTASYVWAIFVALERVDGTVLRKLGGIAERDTSTELRRLRRRGWRVVDSVPFAGYDVDHVAIGPPGVFAVETKRSSMPVTISGTTVKGLYHGNPLGQARQGAKKIQHLLHSKGIDVEVRPVLAIWAHSLPPELDRGIELGEIDQRVLVVSGRRIHDVLGSLPAAAEPAPIALVVEALEAFVRMREANDSATLEPKR
jgi:hypothetical protein